jgi:F-type H+-transporting ATPase subunit gamma
MKMIAQAKVAKAEARLVITRAFARDIESTFTSMTTADESTEAVTDNNTTLLLPFGTDQGLCGSINSGLGRYVNTTAKEIEGEFSLYPTGARTISNLATNFEAKYLGAMFASQKSLTFQQCLQMADIHLSLGEFSTRRLIYNKIVSMSAYEVDEKVIGPRDALEQAEFGAYEVEGGAEVLEDFYDFHYACSLWRILSEVEASELSSRSMAMANSTKAAGEMVDELSLQYSKMRQDIATTEVIEISTGATQTLKNKAQ